MLFIEISLLCLKYYTRFIMSACKQVLNKLKRVVLANVLSPQVVFHFVPKFPFDLLPRRVRCHTEY